MSISIPQAELSLKTNYDECIENLHGFYDLVDKYDSFSNSKKKYLSEYVDTYFNEKVAEFQKRIEKDLIYGSPPPNEPNPISIIRFFQ